MKRKLFTATMAAMMMVSTAVPAMAMVGAKKPESPDMMTITAVQPQTSVEKRITKEARRLPEPVLADETVRTLPAPVLYDEAGQPLPEPILYDQVKDAERVPNVEPGDKRWYTVDPAKLMHVTGMANQYQVQKDDTLWKIAKKTLQTEDVNQIRVGVAKIVEANGLENPDLIYPGEMLNLPL